MDIVFTIPDKDYPGFKMNFLKEHPIPSDSTLTEGEWIREWGRRQYLSAVEKGKIKVAVEESKVDDRIISCKS